MHIEYESGTAPRFTWANVRLYRREELYLDPFLCWIVKYLQSRFSDNRLHDKEAWINVLLDVDTVGLLTSPIVRVEYCIRDGLVVILALGANDRLLQNDRQTFVTQILKILCALKPTFTKIIRRPRANIFHAGRNPEGFPHFTRLEATVPHWHSALAAINLFACPLRLILGTQSAELLKFMHQLCMKFFSC